MTVTGIVTTGSRGSQVLNVTRSTLVPTGGVTTLTDRTTSPGFAAGSGPTCGSSAVTTRASALSHDALDVSPSNASLPASVASCRTSTCAGVSKPRGRVV